MKEAKVSGGNALALSELLTSGEWAASRQWLYDAISQSRRNGCGATLISSELLLAPLANEDRFGCLLQGLKAAEVSKISMLLTLREPVEQLLSLYKHRAKGGTTGRIHDWVEDGYQLPQHMKSLRKQVKESDIELCVRGYTRRPGGLENMFFHDWLGLDPFPEAEDAEVNPSLTLSELELIRRMNDRRSDLVHFLRDHLATVPRKTKIQGNALVTHARAVAANSVWQHREEWARWNEILPEDERLTIPESGTEIPEWPDELEFSQNQVDALAEFMAESTRLRFLVRVFWRGKVRPLLGRVRRRLMGERVNG